MFSEAADKQEKIDAMIAGPFTDFLKSFSDCCLGDTKFLCSDKVTIYDFAVAGMFINFILNKNCKLGTGLAAKYEECASEKLKNYIAAFREDMKEYLAINEAAGYNADAGYFV